MRGFDGLQHPVLNDVVRNVTGGGSQAICVEERPQVFGRVKSRVAGGFHFLIANCGDLRDGAGNIGPHQPANGVQFDANGIDLMRGGETAEGE